MRINLVFLLCYTITLTNLSAQSGFSKTILFPNSTSCTIAAVTVDQDTIVCFGDLYDPNEEKWGVYLAKFDSFGNFLQIRTDFDSNYQQTIDPYSQILRTSDGGYIGVGSQGIGNKTAAYKFSHNGELEWTHFYREDDFQVVINNSVAELSDGYLLFGRYAVNYDNSTFIMKISKSGEFLWFNKDIGIFGYNDAGFCRSAKSQQNHILGSNLFAINADFYSPSFWSKSRLAEVDSMGDLVWEWYSENSDKESSAISLLVTPDHDIIYTANKYIENAFNGKDCKLMIRRVNPQTSASVWLTELPTGNLILQSGLFHMLPSPDGLGFDAVGIKQDIDIGFVVSGIVTHYDWDGNLVWLRYDTIHVDTVLLVSENKLHNLAHLSSGSIVGVGEIKSGSPYGHLEGWLIKWSKNGCLEPGDCATVNTHENLSGNLQNNWKKWEVYPNPASGHTWLHQVKDTPFKQVNVMITNASGQTVHNLSYDQAADFQYKIPLDGLADGLYYYHLSADGKNLQSGRLVVVR